MYATPPRSQDVEDWPKCGGANGSIRFARELAHGANAGERSPTPTVSEARDALQYSQRSPAAIFPTVLTSQLVGAGLKKAVDLLEPYAKKYPTLSYADVYQMASGVAIKVGRGRATREVAVVALPQPVRVALRHPRCHTVTIAHGAPWASKKTLSGATPPVARATRC